MADAIHVPLEKRALHTPFKRCPVSASVRIQVEGLSYRPSVFVWHIHKIIDGCCDDKRWPRSEKTTTGSRKVMHSFFMLTGGIRPGKAKTHTVNRESNYSFRTYCGK